MISADQTIEWMQMSVEQILEKFARTNVRHRIFGDHNYKSLFIPGTRSDKVLLVAHTDTVFTGKVDVGVEGDILYSKNKGVIHYTKNGKRTGRSRPYGIGIGADDRAGVAALWALRELGHSILLTGLEEAGCVGSFTIKRNPIANELMQNHQFAVQFDRRGHNDLVYYRVGSPEFTKYTADVTGYMPTEGTFSDIAVLCEDICGVNMSIGYTKEHTADERLSLSAMNRTIDTAQKWLSQKHLPKFPLVRSSSFFRKNADLYLNWND
jgi:hypothetical protein